MLHGMTGMMRALALLLVGFVVTGCGGGDNSSSSAKDESTPTAEQSTEELQPIEVEECRTTIERADAIASEMETSVIDDPSQFTQMFDRLMILQKKAGSFCSDAVYGPLSKGIYSLALANAGYTGCDFVELCNKQKIERDLIKGTGLVHKAAARSERTS